MPEANAARLRTRNAGFWPCFAALPADYAGLRVIAARDQSARRAIAVAMDGRPRAHGGEAR
ncbi:hypothetical protein T492DRAFT_893832 [Pavlovales sp. CCMP2436]|nr:hypothetical protein T492DRAFT_893832 [Pavlovales sp. CCMP2436]